MGDFPTHNCTYDGTPIVFPTSQLDCDTYRCRSRAEQARLAASTYTLDYIEQRIDESEAAIREAMDKRSTWELYREAAQRKAT